MKNYLDIFLGLLAGLSMLAGSSAAFMYTLEIINYQIKKEQYKSLIEMLPIASIFIIQIIFGYSLYSHNYINCREGVFQYTTLIIMLFLVGIKITRLLWLLLKAVDYETRELEMPKAMDTLLHTLSSDAKAKKIIEDTTDFLCNRNGIKKPELMVCSELPGIAFVDPRKGNMYVHEECSHMESDVLTALVGHELIHWKCKDDTLRIIFVDSAIQIAFIVLFAFFVKLTEIMFDILPLLGAILGLLIIPLMLILLFILIVPSSMETVRYWWQVKELRADRLACELNGVSESGMVKLLRLLRSYNPVGVNKRWHDKIHTRYFKKAPHPSINRRIFLIENYRKWSISDYFIHGFIMSKWFFTGKGWNGT